jgi:hypothetical protein
VPFSRPNWAPPPPHPQASVLPEYNFQCGIFYDQNIPEFFVLILTSLIVKSNDFTVFKLSLYKTFQNKTVLCFKKAWWDKIPMYIKFSDKTEQKNGISLTIPED